MKYAVVGPTHPFKGGISHFTTFLVRHLRQKHEVRFHSFSRQYPGWLFPGNIQPDPSRHVITETCSRTIDALGPRTWWSVAREIVAERPDGLILQWWSPFWLMLHLVLAREARRAGIPVLCMCHHLVEPDSALRGGLRRLVGRLLSRVALAVTDGIVVMNVEDLASVQRWFGNDPVRLATLPVHEGLPETHLSREAARESLGISPEDRVLLFFGFVRAYKGLDLLLEAMNRAKVPPRLVVAGEFWESEQVFRRQIDRLGLSGLVLIHNRYIANEEVAPYFRACDAVVLPYRTGSQSAVAMTAIRYTTPIITTDVGAIGRMVSRSGIGIVSRPGDPEALAGSIDCFFDEDLGGTFADNMRHFGSQGSWQLLVKTLDELRARRCRVPADLLPHGDPPSPSTALSELDSPGLSHGVR